MTPPFHAPSDPADTGAVCSVCGGVAIRYVEGPTGRRRHYCEGHGPTSAEAWTRLRYLAPPSAPGAYPALQLATAQAASAPERAPRPRRRPPAEMRGPADEALLYLQSPDGQAVQAIVERARRLQEDLAELRAELTTARDALRHSETLLQERDRHLERVTRENTRLVAEVARLTRELAAAESVALEALEELPAPVTEPQEGAPSAGTTSSGPESAPAIPEEGLRRLRAEIAASTDEPAAAPAPVPPPPAEGFPAPLGRRATKRPIRAVPKGAVTITPATPKPAPAPEPPPVEAAAPPTVRRIPAAEAVQLGLRPEADTPGAEGVADRVTFVPIERLLRVMRTTGRPQLVRLESTRHAEKAARALSDQDRRLALQEIQRLVEGGWSAVAADYLEAQKKPTRALKVSRALRVILGNPEDGGPWLVLDVTRRGDKRWYRRER